MSVINVTGYVKLPTNDYDHLLQAVANVGPIAISVEASHVSAAAACLVWRRTEANCRPLVAAVAKLRIRHL
jgi:hypothetical protein